MSAAEAAPPPAAVTDLAGVGSDAYQWQFHMDTTAPRIVASSIIEGDLLPTGPLTYTVTSDNPSLVEATLLTGNRSMIS